VLFEIVKASDYYRAVPQQESVASVLWSTELAELNCLSLAVSLN